MKTWQYITTSIVTSIALTGCGGGSDSISTAYSSDSTDTTQTGTFVDAPVAGLTYQTPSLNAETDVNGHFEYKPGESITFKLGGLKIGSVGGAGYATPKSFGSTTAAANLAYILQNIDTDGNATNGVIILPSSDIIKTYFSQSDVNTLDLENNTTIQTLLPGLKTYVASELDVTLPDVNITEAVTNMDNSIDTFLLNNGFSIDFLLNKSFYLPHQWGDDPTYIVLVKFYATKSSVTIDNITDGATNTPGGVSVADNRLTWTEDGGEALEVVDKTDKGLVVLDAGNRLLFFYNSEDDAQAALNFQNSFTSSMIDGKTFYLNVRDNSIFKKYNISFASNQITITSEGLSETYDYTIQNGIIQWTDQEGDQELRLLEQTDKGFVISAETAVANSITPDYVLLCYTDEAERDTVYTKLPH